MIEHILDWAHRCSMLSSVGLAWSKEGSTSKKKCEGALCGCHGEASNARSVALISRRRLLGGAFVGAAASVVAGAELTMPSIARAQTIKSPAEALQVLVEGNRRFVDRKLTFYQEDLAILQQNTIEKQEPFA
jgi:carbonic anhydrase